VLPDVEARLGLAQAPGPESMVNRTKVVGVCITGIGYMGIRVTLKRLFIVSRKTPREAEIRTTRCCTVAAQRPRTVLALSLVLRVLPAN
jgi:hypothetical protein